MFSTCRMNCSKKVETLNQHFSHLNTTTVNTKHRVSQKNKIQNCLKKLEKLLKNRTTTYIFIVLVKKYSLNKNKNTVFNIKSAF